jgi:hypothetical protein
MGKACSTHRKRRRRIYIGFWWERKKELDHWEDLDYGGRLILQRILERYGWIIAIELI